MSVRPALVDCVVLSLQDTRVFYPYCRGCFSRIQAEPQDPTRWRCSRCGYSCLRENVDHRYRLSLRVTRSKCIFGVTVFGTCLNPFFGIHATGLQRLVENTDGPLEPSTRSTMLVKAVQDCFIGRHVIFGIKVTETEPEPWLGRRDGSCSSDTAQLIASQMILPKALSLGGCTVVSYYQRLLQKAAEFELGSTDPSLRPPEAPLLLLPCYSPASSFNHAYHCISSLQNQSLQRSQCQDCPLTPTPPWQQSLGLVTSSAEQEEGLSTQDSSVEDDRKRGKNKTPNHKQKDDKGHHKEERRVSPPSPVQRSTFSSPSFAKYSCSPIDKAVENTSILDTSFSPCSPDHSSSKKKRFSTSHLTNTILSESLAWEDFPFSESLTEFLGEEKKEFIIGTESEPNLKVQNQKETTRNNLEVRSGSMDLSVESSVCQQYKQITDSRSQILLEVMDTPVSKRADRRDISDQICEKPVQSEARTLLSQEDETGHSPFLEREEEQIDGDTYDCSAELFSSSPLTSMNKTTLTTYTESVGMSTEAPSQLSVPKIQLTRRGWLNVPHLTPRKQQLEMNKCINEDCLIPPGSEELDFIPPSQSTPIVKVSAVAGSATSKKTSTSGVLQTRSPDSNSCYKNLPQLDGKGTPRIPLFCGSESTKENLLQSSTSRRHRFISKRRFWKHKKPLLAQRPSRVQRVDLSSGSPERLNHTFDLSYDDVTVCDNEDQYSLFVPPTPAAKSPPSVRIRERNSQTLDSSSNLVWTCGELQGDGAGCKKSVLDQNVTPSQRGVAQIRHCETLEKETSDESNCYFPNGENEACDWSRDLFSDSV